MHDPNFGLGMDARIHLWHPCKAEVNETNHNGVDWVDIRFMRHIGLGSDGFSTEQVEVQVRREAARDLMCRLLELFPVEAGRMIGTLINVHIRGEEPCLVAIAEES